MILVRLRLFLLLLLAPLAATAATGVYRGALVIDAADGRVLFEDRADYVGPPASVTKLMSFLVVHDAIRAGRITLRTPVTTSAADSRIGGTQVWLKEGEVFAVEELLMAMMIKSANDAAHALAHATSGSREAFIAAMNARARQLGMTQTTWRTPHGLPPASRQLAESDVTSPRDLARLCQVLLQETDILRYTSIPLAYFGQGQRPEAVMMDNHNNLVGKVRGVDGLKTGYTAAAGFCLAATAERDGRRLIGVIMGSPSTKERDIKMAELLEAAFARAGPAPAEARSPISPAPVAPATIAPATVAPAAAPATTHDAAAPIITRLPADPVDPRGSPEPGSAQDGEPPTVRFQLPPR